MPLASRLLILLAVAILLVTVLRVSMVSSQTADQPGFSQALIAVRSAEAAGATPSEVAPLVALLNNALQLNGTVQANQLATIQSRAGQLQSLASQRTYTSNLISYVSGGVGALLAAIVCAYFLSFWRRYRVKRAFRMRIYKK